MQADILDAVATLLGDELAVPVYYPEQPRSEWTRGAECIVITPGGSIPTEGDASWAPLARLRADLRCYGPTDYRALKVYRDAAEILHDLRPQIVECDGVYVKLHNATLAQGPTSAPDPDTKEACVYATWGVHGHETEIEVDHRYIFKTADETNTTTDFANDDELRFTVEEGHLYRANLWLLAIQDHDGTPNSMAINWDVPTDVDAKMAGSVPNTLEDGAQETIQSSDNPDEPAISLIPVLINAEQNGGECVLQFRRPSDANNGGVTVLAGSYIELLKVH